ncbi:PH domain-containing protein [Bacillus sp. B15-48]|nr:PH domain-containing protein [Bacillus sp. B15-48]MBM4765391.1 PH domain-containing protein [Bacillus sp. B15-48]
MFEPKRLHPLAALLNTLRQLKELIIPFILFFVFGDRWGDGKLFYIITSIVVLLLVLVSGFLSWYRFTYRVQEGELRIEHGIFVRKKRYIPFERIQSLDVSAGIFHRPLGLVKVKVETAGGAGGEEAEAVLTAVAKGEAEQIHELLVSIKKSSHTSEQEEVIEREEIIYKITIGQLLLLASTSGGVGVVLSAIFAFIIQFDELIPYDRLFNEVEHLISFGIMFISIIVFLVFLIAWSISVIGTMLKYASFTLKKVDNDLIITRGLLEKKQFTIPLHRIQAVRYSENVLRQPFGLASVYVDSAGGSALNEESSKVLILPLIKKREIATLLEPYLIGYPFNAPLISAPSRAYRRYLFKAWIFVIPIALMLIYHIRPWGYLSLLLVFFSAFWAWLIFKDAASGVNQDVLILRYRQFVKNTVFMKREKIQSLSVKKSYFQARKKLATIEATVKSGHGGSGGRVVDLEGEEIDKVYKWYSYSNINQCQEDSQR